MVATVFAGSMTVGLPPYAFLVILLLWILYRDGGSRVVRRYLWTAPILYLALFWGMWGALVGSSDLRIPALLFYGAIAFAVGCIYAAIAWFGWTLLARLQEGDAGSSSHGGH